MEDTDILTIRSISHHFGDNIVASLRRAFLLLTLIKIYITDITHHRQDVQRNDGFIVRKADEILVLTGITSQRVLYEDLDFLVSEGLIEKKKGYGVKIRIDTQKDLLLINDWTFEYKEYKDDFFKESSRKKKEFLNTLHERSKRNLESIKKDDKEYLLSHMNPYDPETYKNDFSYEEGWLIRLFSHYYRAYTGQDYIWTLVKLNTLMVEWKSGIDKDWPERALSKALKVALNNRKSNTYLELKWRTEFNPDIRPDGMLFDALFEEN